MQGSNIQVGLDKALQGFCMRVFTVLKTIRVFGKIMVLQYLLSKIAAKFLNIHLCQGSSVLPGLPELSQYDLHEKR